MWMVGWCGWIGGLMGSIGSMIINSILNVDRPTSVRAMAAASRLSVSAPALWTNAAASRTSSSCSSGAIRGHRIIALRRHVAASDSGAGRRAVIDAGAKAACRLCPMGIRIRSDLVMNQLSSAGRWWGHGPKSIAWGGNRRHGPAVVGRCCCLSLNGSTFDDL